MLIAERKRHETEEATSAVTYRYKKAEAESVLEAVAANHPDGKSVDLERRTAGTDAEKSSNVKSSIVNEITRVISASLTSTAKLDTTGLERRVRWRGLGVIAGEIESQSEVPPPQDAGSNLTTSARKVYSTLAKHLPYSFSSAGITPFHPLKHGSLVLVGFMDKVWLGIGMYLYISYV